MRDYDHWDDAMIHWNLLLIDRYSEILLHSVGLMLHKNSLVDIERTGKRSKLGFRTDWGELHPHAISCFLCPASFFWILTAIIRGITLRYWQIHELYPYHKSTCQWHCVLDLLMHQHRDICTVLDPLSWYHLVSGMVHTASDHQNWRTSDERDEPTIVAAITPTCSWKIDIVSLYPALLDVGDGPRDGNQLENHKGNFIGKSKISPVVIFQLDTLVCQRLINPS